MNRIFRFRLALRGTIRCLAVALLGGCLAAAAQEECRDPSKVLVATVSFPETNLSADAAASLKARLTGRCFDASRFGEMRQRLQEGLENLGYLHGNVGDPTVEFLDRNSQPKRVALTFPLAEGAQYSLGSVQWEGVNNLTPAQMEAMIEMRPGDAFDASKVRRAMVRMRSLYDSNGYKKARITPETVLNDGDHTVTLTFRVEEGQR